MQWEVEYVVIEPNNRWVGLVGSGVLKLLAVNESLRKAIEIPVKHIKPICFCTGEYAPYENCTLHHIAVSTDHEVTLHDYYSNNKITYKEPLLTISSYACYKGRYVAIGTKEGILMLLQLENDKFECTKLKKLQPNLNEITCITTIDNASFANYIAYGSANGAVTLQNTQGEQIFQLKRFSKSNVLVYIEYSKCT